jgi:exoribonuclease R
MVLQHRVGEVFDGVVVEAGGRGGTVQLTHPAVRGRLLAEGAPLGQRVSARLVTADPTTRSVTFELA